jgi:hypothetical protein
MNQLYCGDSLCRKKLFSCFNAWKHYRKQTMNFAPSIKANRASKPPSNGNGSNGHLKEILPLWKKPSKDKLRILDLFCCAGGVAMGYSRAGFDIVGVDIDPQPRFPFEFIQADALTLDMKFIKSFDAIHASPPCQSYSDLAKRNGNAHEWPRLIEPVRELLIRSGKPYVIERTVQLKMQRN